MWKSFFPTRNTIKQEGPESPGSLTWGKGQRSHWSHLQRTTNIVHQRGPLDDVIHQLWKLWALYFQTRRFFKIAFLKPNFWPRDLLMQPPGTVWTTLIGDHPGIIPVKFGQIPIRGSREDVVWSFPYITQC